MAPILDEHLMMYCEWCEGFFFYTHECFWWWEEEYSEDFWYDITYV